MVSESPGQSNVQHNNQLCDVYTSISAPTQVSTKYDISPHVQQTAAPRGCTQVWINL